MLEEKRPLDEAELRYARFLKDTSIGSVLGVLESCPVRRLKSGETLIEARQSNYSIYLVLSGRLEVRLKLNLDPIAVLETGEIVGEVSVIDGQPTTAFVVAKEDSRVLAMSEDVLWSLVASSPGLARNLLYILAQRLRHGDAIIQRAQEQAIEQTRHNILDPVTGTYNHNWLESMLPKQIERAKRSQTLLSVIVVSLDYFPSYFATNGPLAADRALYTVAWTLRQNMRPGELIARYRKAEFAVLLPETDADIAQSIADRVCKAISKVQIYDLNRQRLPSVSVSLGVVQIRAGETPVSLMSAARRALSSSQKKGGNQVSFATRNV